MQNPWFSLPVNAPFTLEMDEPLLHRLNSTASAQFRYDLSLYPEPYFGSLSAPVVLLALNPGWSSEDAATHARQDFAAMARASLHHSLAPYPFLHLQPGSNTPGGKWWKQRTKELICDVGFDAAARGLACVQFMPYHSLKYRPNDSLLPSQEYSFALVRAAMERKAEVVLMRSKKSWFKAIPELEGYNHLHTATNPRSPYLSRGNLKGAYEVIANRLRLSS